MLDTCPFCGEELFLDGLDILHGQDGDLSDWAPCCLELREMVEREGWEAVFGEALEASLSAFGLGEVREHYWDGFIRYKLELFSPDGPISGWRGQVFALVNKHHRHHRAPLSWKFGVAVFAGGRIVGVAVVGRPVARMIQKLQPGTLEVTRVCTFGDARARRNVSSMLYGACCRQAKARGADKLITYTLETEDGASLRASNFTAIAKTRGGSWNRQGRAREDKAPTCPKTRWERAL